MEIVAAAVPIIEALEPIGKKIILALIAALRDGKVSHDDVLAQLGTAEGSEHAAADALAVADKEADEAAEREKALPPPASK